MLTIVFLFLLGFILIIKGADVFIDSTINIARKTNIPEIVLGATLVSLATTFPELTVSTFAAIEGHTTMSLGNAVGSIICNTGLILGLVAILAPFKVNKDIFKTKSIILLISAITLMILSIDKNIDKTNSIILLSILVLYMGLDYIKMSKDKSVNTSNNQKGSITKGEILKTSIFFILGLAMMIIGSKLLVNNGVKIAEVLGVPQAIISLTIIALGTSLPELVSCMTAIIKKHHALSVGNILGANILNICSVIGISSFINDIPILSQTTQIDFPFMIALLLILIVPTIFKHKIYRFQGILLLLTYIVYIATLYFTYIAR